LASISWAGIRGRAYHHDPSAEHGSGGAAALREQPRLGAAGIGRMAADALVMIARNQTALVAQRADACPRQMFEAVAPSVVGVGRRGIAEYAGARAAARRHPLDELGGLLDPAGVEHGAGPQEHQPWRTCLTGTGRQRS